MRLWDKWKKESWFSLAVAICIGVTFYMLLSHIGMFTSFFAGVWAIVKPLLYGLILAYLMDPIARFYQVKLFSKMKKQNIARKICVVLAIITVLIVFTLLIVAVFPPLVQSISSMVTSIAGVVSSLNENSGDLSSILPPAIAKMFKGVSLGPQYMDKITDMFSGSISSIADSSASVGSGIVDALIAFILAIYYMMDKERLQTIAKRFCFMIFKEAKYERFRTIIKRIDSILLNYIKGNIIEGTIVGVINGILMMIFGMPYILLISVVVGVTNLAPTFGPIVGALIGALLLLLQNPVDALIFLIFTVVLQTIDGYIIKPRLFGDSFGVSPLLILISIIIGGRIMGVVGILLAIPFAAIVQFLVNGVWAEYRTKKKIPGSESNISGTTPPQE
ncbi:MAG: AI-2E family transporter [Lachnospiraceae bacterium]|nr:AI-2E family transporter [Lachnospiraceae bacterium]